MWVHARSLLGSLFVGSALFVAADSCSHPTYVTLKLTTDVPCERLRGVSITTGVLGSLEDKPATTVTNDCAGDEIGTLTVTPSGDDDSEFGVLVVAGLERAVESCKAPDYGDGCIVARRGLRYVADKSLNLPIILRQICNGIPCGPYDTCVKGVCLPAKIDDPNKCESADGCGEEALVTQQTEKDGGIPNVEAGGVDGGVDYARVPLSEICGAPAGSALDLTAPWPMEGGCPTRARRAAVVGPKRAQLVTTPSLYDQGRSWTGLVTTNQNRGFGKRYKPGTGGGYQLGTIDLSNGTAQDIGASPSSCMVWTDGVHCYAESAPYTATIWNQTGQMTFSGVFPSDLGASFAPTQVTVGSNNRTVVGYGGVVDGGYEYYFATYGSNGARTATSNQPITLGPRAVAMSRDGNVAFVSAQFDLFRYDLATGAMVKSGIPNVISAPVVADDDTVLVCSYAGLHRLDESLATNGDAPVKLWNANPLLDPIIGVGRAGAERRAIVLSPYEKKLYSVRLDAAPQTIAWTISTDARDFLIASDDVIYLVEPTNVVAVDANGKEIWREGMPYNAGDITIGVDSSLFVSIGENLFHSAP